MKIAVVIIHFGSIATTQGCLKKLTKKLAGNQVILINNTPDNISSIQQIIPGTKLIDNHQNLGFARGVNQGIREALKDQQIEGIFLMNNDLSLDFGGFNQLFLVFNKISTAGIVTPILHHRGGYDWGGKYNPWTGLVKHKNWDNKPKTVQSVTHVAGAAMLIKRELIDKIGYFDERFFLYYEDLDFCLRTLSAGFTIHITPDVVAEHQVSASSRLYRRTLNQWSSHTKFVLKHFLRRTYPTALLTDLIFYPLIVIKTIIFK